MMRLFVVAAASLSLTVCAQGAETGFQWVDHPDQGTADLMYNGQPTLRYMYAFDRSSPQRTVETFKVYHHVFGPGTDDLITNGPTGLYPHHRGLFVGWRRTRYDGGEIDSWHCTKGAHQRHVRFLQRHADQSSGEMTSEIAWNDGSGKPVINETRQVRVRNVGPPNGPPTWSITWISRLQSRRGTIALSGDRQHAGFQFRAAQSVAESKSATFIRPKGFPEQAAAYEVDDRKDPDKYINLGWLAMSYEINGKRYTVTYFEDPAMPKPSKFSERPYGRFGAYFQATVTPQQPLVLRYRVLVSTGPSPDRNSIQKQYDAFAAEMARVPLSEER